MTAAPNERETMIHPCRLGLAKKGHRIARDAISAAVAAIDC